LPKHFHVIWTLPSDDADFLAVSATAQIRCNSSDFAASFEFLFFGLNRNYRHNPKKIAIPGDRFFLLVWIKRD